MVDARESFGRKDSQPKIDRVDWLREPNDLNDLVGASPMSEASVTTRNQDGSFVLFRSQSTMYAAPVELVATVIQSPPLGLLPQAPPWLRGVVYLSGDVVPMVSLALLGEDHLRSVESTSSRCMVLSLGSVKLGLEVDEVFGVRSLELRPPVVDASSGEPASDSPRTLDPAAPAGHDEATAAQGQDERASLSEPPFWRLMVETTVDHGVAGSESGPDAQTPIRVIDLSRLLANKRLTQFANRGALEAAVGANTAKTAVGQESS